MRENYTITDETRSVLTDKVKPIASEMDVDTSYLYQILSSATCDPFGKFRRLYAACVRSGADVTPWDACLSSIKTRSLSSPQITESKCVSEITGKAATLIQQCVLALEDGVIEPHEAGEIRRSVTKVRNSLEALEAKLETPERRERAKEVTNGRFGK